MKHTYTIEAETEAELHVYATALARYCACCDFESALRTMWKHSDLSEVSGEDAVDRIRNMWHETKIAEID